MRKPAPTPAAHTGRAPWVAVLIGVSLLPGCAATGHRAGYREPAASPVVGRVMPATVYVARRQWHIDVGFAAKDVHGPLAAVAAMFPGAQYLFFGFGDRHYLMSKDRQPSTVHMPNMLAALWPGPGLILVTAIDGTPRQAFGDEHVVELEISGAQSDAIQEFIVNSMSTALGQPPAPFAVGPYSGSVYFAAVPEYSGLHTCNTWAAESFRAGGLAVRSRLTLLAAQLWHQVLRLRAPFSIDGSVAGRRVPVLAYHGRVAALGDDHGRLGGGRRTAAADATGQQPGREYRTD